MNRRYNHFVKGTFEGSFKTFQDLHLTAGDPFPDGDLHLIRVYRGVISDTQEIKEIEFHQLGGQIDFKEVNNIQISKSDNWKDEYSRIYSIGHLKIANISITGVHSMNGHTYGNIKGYAAGSVSSEVFKEKNWNENKEDQYVPWWDYRKKKWWKDNFESEANEDKNNNTDDDSFSGLRGDHDFNKGGGNSDRNGKRKEWEERIKNKGCYRAAQGGCLSIGCGSGCLKWLFYLILFILLLWWILCFTSWGEQWICRFKLWRVEKEIVEMVRKREEQEDIIRRTRPPAAQCGGSQLFNGDNQPRTFTYTLGSTSGKVLIAYDMFDVPDRMEVVFNGALVAETQDKILEPEKFPNLVGRGFASGKDTLVYNYTFKSTELHELTIRIIPNEEKSTTQWNFNVICP